MTAKRFASAFRQPLVQKNRPTLRGTQNPRRPKIRLSQGIAWARGPRGFCRLMPDNTLGSAQVKNSPSFAFAQGSPDVHDHADDFRTIGDARAADDACDGQDAGLEHRLAMPGYARTLCSCQRLCGPDPGQPLPEQHLGQRLDAQISVKAARSIRLDLCGCGPVTSTARKERT